MGRMHDGVYVNPNSQAESDNRYRIVTEILHTLPESIPVVIRYPVFVKELMDRATAPPVAPCNAGRQGPHRLSQRLLPL